MMGDININNMNCYALSKQNIFIEESLTVAIERMGANYSLEWVRTIP